MKGLAKLANKMCAALLQEWIQPIKQALEASQAIPFLFELL
jgi:hypothetical protein